MKFTEKQFTHINKSKTGFQPYEQQKYEKVREQETTDFKRERRRKRIKKI